ncbi:MAG: hypothetical protein ABH865_02485 [Candidatus Omnitrophota bacterium]|nr:hypothetical protein [Candidatus Omnitrophota bacterium]
MDPEKKPIGVVIFGGLNCFFLGFFLLLIFLVTYFTTKPSDLAGALALFEKKGIAVSLTWQQFKVMNLIYIALAFFFIVSGWGLLTKKQWARKATVYFSFAWLFLAVFTVVLNPSFIGQIAPYAAYPGFLAIYFTSKKIEKHFGG